MITKKKRSLTTLGCDPKFENATTEYVGYAMF